MSEWIDVNDALPPQDREIIVHGGHSCKVWCTEVYHEHMNGKPTGRVLDWDTYRDLEIYHWMPLPEPPEVKVSEWTNIEEQPLPIGQDLLVAAKNGQYLRMASMKHFLFLRGEAIPWEKVKFTHWMKLPDSPEVDDE